MRGDVAAARSSPSAASARTGGSRPRSTAANMASRPRSRSRPADRRSRQARLARLEASGARIHRTHTKARTVAILPWLLARNARGGRPPYLFRPAAPLRSERSAMSRRPWRSPPRSKTAPFPSRPTSSPRSAPAAPPPASRSASSSPACDPASSGSWSTTSSASTHRVRPLRAAHRRVARASWRPFGPTPDRAGHARPDPRPDPSGGTAIPRGRPRAAALAAEEGLPAHPVYTAKAMAGLLALREEGRLDGTTLFIHTDGPR